MAGGPTLTCPRDGTPTQLTCTRCEAPICPSCAVRTDVGLRCPDCAEAAQPSSPPVRRARPLVVAGVLAVGALVLVVGLAVARHGSSGRSGAPGGAAAPQHVTRPDLGFSLDLPSSWTVDVDRTPGVVFFAHAVPPRSSARIFRGQTVLTLDQTMANVTDELRQQGAHDFSQTPVQIGDLSGIRLDYSADDGPSGASATHSAYRVKKGNAVFSLSLATTDPASDGRVLSDVASSFRVL